MSGKKLLSRNKFPIKLGTGIRVSKTGPNLPPILVIHNMVPQPRREPGQPVLLVPATRDGVPARGAGDDEGEDEEDEEGGDEDGHTHEVEGEEGLLVPVGADEAGEGDEEEGDADEDDGPAEPVDAGVVGLGGEPDARGDDGD